MADEDVELVRRIYQLWDRRESARDLIAETVEYVNPSYAVEPGTRRGRRSFTAVNETLEGYALRVERIIDAGDGDVVVLGTYTAAGRESGVPVFGEQGHVWTVRGGQAVRFQWFNSHGEALEAAGLKSL